MTVNEMKELRDRAQIEGEIYCSQWACSRWADHFEDMRIGEIEALLRRLGERARNIAASWWRSATVEKGDAFICLEIVEPVLCPTKMTDKGEWRLRLRRAVAEARHPEGLRELEGAKDLVFGGVSFKDDAPWQISYVWYPNESCQDDSAVHEPGYDEMLYMGRVETGWQTPDVTGQEWAELIARNSWAPRVLTDPDCDDIDKNVDLAALRHDFMAWKKHGVSTYLNAANKLIHDPSKEWKRTAQSCTIYVLDGNPRLVITVKDDELLKALVPNGNTKDWRCDFSRGVSDVSRIMRRRPPESASFSESHWQLRILHHPQRPEYGRESDVKFTLALTPEEQQLADGIADELFKRRECNDEED